MKKIASVIILISLLWTACHNKTEPQEKNSETVEGVYHFAETSDKTFCSSDSIIPGDCGFGEIYLTKKGNVTYYFYCLGADTATYSIGKYVVTDSSIVCSFNRDYCYGLDCIGQPGCEDTIPADPSSGKIRPTETWTIDLIKSNCKSFQYFIRPTKEQIEESKKGLEEAKKGNYTLIQFRGYVLSKLADKETKQYIDSLLKIKPISDL